MRQDMGSDTEAIGNIEGHLLQHALGSIQFVQCGLLDALIDASHIDDLDGSRAGIPRCTERSPERIASCRSEAVPHSARSLALGVCENPQVSQPWCGPTSLSTELVFFVPIASRQTGDGPVRSNADWVFVVRILSADCAKPLFGAFGLELEERQSTAVSDAARDCYRLLLGKAESIYHIDFDPKRIRSSIESFMSSVTRVAGSDVARRTADFGDWYCRTIGNQDSTPDALWSTLLVELVSGHPNAIPPDRISKRGLNLVMTSYRTVLDEYNRFERVVNRALEAKGISRWDQELLTHTPKLPSQLPDAILSIAHARLFRRFWYEVQGRLDREDLDALKDWLLDQASVIVPSIDRDHFESLEKDNY